MSLGYKMQALRKEKKMSQEHLGREVGTSGSIIGRYERDEIVPSIEIVKKIAEKLDVSIDYLVDENGNLSYFKDKGLIERIAKIEKLPNEDKQHVYFLIDTVVRDSQARKAYSH